MKKWFYALSSHRPVRFEGPAAGLRRMPSRVNPGRADRAAGPSVYVRKDGTLRPNQTNQVSLHIIATSRSMALM